MKLSVVIPFFRELDLIGRAVDSVIQNADAVDQTEILVCNDGGIPESDIIDRLSEQARHVTRVLRNSGPKGPGGARNTGLDASTGDVIAFLDADDFWLPGKLAEQSKAIKSGASFVATGYVFEGVDVRIQPPTAVQRPLDIFLRRGIGTSTVAVTRDLLEPFRFRDIRFAQDIDFWYRLANSPRFKYHGVQAPFAAYSRSGSTRNKWEQLGYVNKVLVLNDVPWVARARILSSYISAGIFNHYIKPLLLKP